MSKRVPFRAKPERFWGVRDQQGKIKLFASEGLAADYAEHINAETRARAMEAAFGPDKGLNAPRPGETGQLWIINYRAENGLMDQWQILAETEIQALGLFLQRKPWAITQYGGDLSVEPYRELAVRR